MVRNRIPRLTIVQLMRLVAYCAVAMACVAPIARIEQATRGSIGATAVFGAVSVPLAWAGLSFVLVRRGPARDRLILGLLFGSVAVALGFGLVILGFMIVSSLWGRGVPPRSMLGSTAGAVFLLLAASVFLARRLLRRDARRPDAQAPAEPRPSPGS